MFQRQQESEPPICPECGSKLSQENDLLFCQEHGAFFAYGPQLLVRAARPATKPNEPVLPWETPRTR